MRTKYKSIYLGIMFIVTILIVSKLSVFSIDYEDVLEYKSENIELTNEIHSSASYELENSLDKEDIINSDKLNPQRVVTVWTNRETPIYDGKTDKSPIINTLYEGEKIQVEKLDENWYRILSTDDYILSSYISFSKVDMNLRKIEWVTCDLPFKENYNKDSRNISILEAGSTVSVNEFINEEWAKVTVNDKIGYVEIIHLSETEYIPPKELKLGTFTITHYCNCSICCGIYAGLGLTASGAPTVAGTTIAVDPSVIPYGTKVIINGHTYIAQDCGSAVNGNHIDVYCNTHEEALSRGTYYTDDVIILLEE